jgi:spermidine synthase
MISISNKSHFIALLCASCFPFVTYSENPFFAEIDRDKPKDSWVQSMEIEEQIFNGKTDYQDIVIFENPELGRILALDGIIQTTEGDEFIYHEMLNQVPLLAHSNPKSVLVIGGGDGGSIREILRHQSVEKVTMCDLDSKVIELCKKYIPNISRGAFNDPRLELVIRDGTKFVKETKNRYDVIIIDSTDPIGPGKVLFSNEFYADCKKIMNKNGILVAQNGIPFYDGFIVRDSYQNLSPNFKIVKFFVAPVPTYLGGFMVFSFSTDAEENCNRSVKELKAKMGKLHGKMGYYTPGIHKASFHVPQYILNLINKKD